MIYVMVEKYLAIKDVKEISCSDIVYDYIYKCRTCKWKSRDWFWCDVCLDRLFPIDEELTKEYNILVDYCASIWREDIVKKHLFAYYYTNDNTIIYRNRVIRMKSIYEEFINLLLKENIISLTWDRKSYIYNN